MLISRLLSTIVTSRTGSSRSRLWATRSRTNPITKAVQVSVTISSIGLATRSGGVNTGKTHDLSNNVSAVKTTFCSCLVQNSQESVWVFWFSRVCSRFWVRHRQVSWLLLLCCTYWHWVRCEAHKKVLSWWKIFECFGNIFFFFSSFSVWLLRKFWEN